MNLATALEKSELGAKADRSVHGNDGWQWSDVFDINRSKKDMFEHNGLHWQTILFFTARVEESYGSVHGLESIAPNC